MDGAPCVPPAADSDSVSDAHRAAVDDQPLVRERQEGEQALKPIDGQKTTRWRETALIFLFVRRRRCPPSPAHGRACRGAAEWRLPTPSTAVRLLNARGARIANKQTCDTRARQRWERVSASQNGTARLRLNGDAQCAVSLALPAGVRKQMPHL